MLRSRLLLSHAERASVAALSALTAFANPERGDMIAILGETTGRYALKHLQQRMQSDATGQLLLASKPRVTEAAVNLPALRLLPPHTFGSSYARYVDAHGFSPDGRVHVLFLEDPELAYVMQRYREIHDFLHTLTGLTPSVADEVSLKWFEMVQTSLPLCALSAFVGPVRAGPAGVAALRSGIPWACSAASAASFMLNVHFEKHFETDLNEFRKQLNLKPFRV